MDLKKVTILSLKSRSHVRILKYRTWAIIKIGLKFLAFLLVKKTLLFSSFQMNGSPLGLSNH